MIYMLLQIAFVVELSLVITGLDLCVAVIL
jgi:hypothetical protein